MCAQVGLLPGPKRTSAKCAEKDVVKRLTKRSEWSGYCVDWRYVTRDRRWVMVRDTSRDISRAGWVFVPRSALAADRGTWPAYRTYEGGPGRGTCNQEGS